MKHYGNLDNVSASAMRRKGPKVNHATGTPATVVTPDQLGISITKSVFGWKYPASGSKAANGADLGTNTAASQYIDEYGLPFIFVVNGSQILLPPVVTAGGTPVPYLPDGLTVEYAPSFMGVTIPSDMIRPVSAGGKLKCNAATMASAQNIYTSMTSRAGGSWTNALLLNNGVDNGVNMGETLLRILMATFECLIYSYSSYPWGNGYGDLSQALMTQRGSLSDFLVYPYQTKTFLGNIIQQAAPVYANTIAPLAAQAANAVAPGSGAIITAEANAIKNASAASSANQQPQDISAALTTFLAPSGTLTDASGNVIQSGVPGGISPIILLAIVAVVVFLILK